MTLLLHRYRPHNVGALTLLAAADQEERATSLYAADMAWLTASIIHRIGGGKRFDVASPSARYRELRKPRATPAHLSNQQVISRVTDMFRTFRAKRGENT